MAKKKKRKAKRPAKATASKRGGGAAGARPRSRSEARPIDARGTDAALLTAVEGAREIWKKGDVRKAGRQVIRGERDLRSALRSLAKPARDLLDKAVAEHERVAEEERSAEHQLGEALRERRVEERARTMKRGGKTETVMRGVVSGPDGEPIPGLVVEGRRAGTKRATLLAVDVTDDSGRYQLVVPNEELGSGKSARLSVEVGLDRGAVLHAPGQAFKVDIGTATDHDLALPEEQAGLARQAVARRDDLDVARMHARNRRSARLEAEQKQLAALAEGLGALLGGVGADEGA